MTDGTVPAQFQAGDIESVPFRKLAPGDAAAFEHWVKGLTAERDNENGPDTWQWVVTNNAGFPADGPYETFVFFDRTTRQIVGTITLTPDDRDVAKKAGLTCLGFMGFHCVRHDLRGRGLGRLIAVAFDIHVQVWTDQTGRSQLVYLFTDDPRRYQGLGYQPLSATVPFLGHDETLCVKTYEPRTGC